MKKIILAIFMIVYSLQIDAQLKHYISINKVYYANYFNKERDKPEDISTFLPISLSYKIERDRWGVELWYTQLTTFYNSIRMGYVNSGDISRVYQDIVCLNVQYAALQHKRIKVNPFVGLIYREYHALVFDGWKPFNPYHPQNSREITHDEDEKNFGLQTGVNINFPIYWGIYANTNLRYNAIPWANYNKQNLYWEVGLGYCIQRKRK